MTILRFKESRIEITNDHNGCVQVQDPNTGKTHYVKPDELAEMLDKNPDIGSQNW